MRYSIQMCSLDDVVRKSEVRWLNVTFRFTLNGARKKFNRLESKREPNIAYRVFNTKTQKPVV